MYGLSDNHILDHTLVALLRSDHARVKNSITV